MTMHPVKAVHTPIHLRRGLLALGAILVTACGADAMLGVSAEAPNARVTAIVGQEIDITLGSIGPAAYETPPSISSGAVAYLRVDVLGPPNPGGPTLRFRFRAMHTGTAIVHFRRMLGDSVVSTLGDTIQVL